MSFLLTIITGSFASLIATIIWVITGELFSLTSRSKNAQLLNDAENMARAIYHNLEFDKYDLAMIYCVELYRLIKELRINLFFLNYPNCKERKLFFTYIYQIEGIINITRNLSIGGRDAQEEDGYRCQKLLNTYFTVKGYHTVEILIAVLRNFNESKNYTKSFSNLWMAPDITKEIIFDLIEVNHFKQKKDKDLLRKKGFTKEEYKQFLDNYYKNDRK